MASGTLIAPVLDTPSRPVSTPTTGRARVVKSAPTEGFGLRPEGTHRSINQKVQEALVDLLKKKLSIEVGASPVDVARRINDLSRAHKTVTITDDPVYKGREFVITLVSSKDCRGCVEIFVRGMQRSDYSFTAAIADLTPNS